MAMLLRTALRQAMLRQASPMMSKSLPMTTVSSKDEMKKFWIKNETMKRPKSPHLTIWAWQLPMNLSLFHRITGMAMAVGVYGFAWGTLALPWDYTTMLTTVRDLSFVGPALITTTKFVLAWPVCYHYFNGIRHLAWDACWGFDLKTLYKSGYTVLTIATVAAALVATQL